MARSSGADPLDKFRFKLEFDYVGTGVETSALTRAGFHDVQMPKRSTNKIAYREGNDKDINSYSAGLSTMEDIVCSRGLMIQTLDEENTFYKWASSVHKHGSSPLGYGAGNETSKKAGEADVYRKDLKLSMYTRDGKIARSWKIYNAFPVNFVPGSDLNSSEDGEKSMEQLTITYEDFQELDIVESLTTTPPDDTEVSSQSTGAESI